MVRYLIKKILETLLTLFIVTTVVFFFVRMIPGDRLEVRGFGELRPVAANLTPDGKDDPAGQRRNRRVEVIIAKTS